MARILWVILAVILLFWLVELLFGLVGMGGFVHTLLLVALVIGLIAFLAGGTRSAV